MIHKFSEVSPNAKIGENVTIGPFCVIEDDVVIGDGCVLMSNVHVFPGTRLGKNNRIFPGASIGAVPQDLKFVGEYTTLEVGDNNTIRECVTLNRGTASRGKTVIGSNNLIMAYCHVGHDCVLGSHIVMSNAIQVAGEVEIDDWAVIGGGSCIPQFSKVGKHSMTSGMSGLNKDVPPYAYAGRTPVQYCGYNKVGMERRGFTPEQVNTVKECYRIIYQMGLNMTAAVEKLKSDMPESEERNEILAFIARSQHGILVGPKL